MLSTQQHSSTSLSSSSSSFKPCFQAAKPPPTTTATTFRPVFQPNRTTTNNNPTTTTLASSIGSRKRPAEAAVLVETSSSFTLRPMKRTRPSLTPFHLGFIKLDDDNDGDSAISGGQEEAKIWWPCLHFEQFDTLLKLYEDVFPQNKKEQKVVAAETMRHMMNMDLSSSSPSPVCLPIGVGPRPQQPTLHFRKPDVALSDEGAGFWNLLSKLVQEATVGTTLHSAMNEFMRLHKMALVQQQQQAEMDKSPPAITNHAEDITPLGDAATIVSTRTTDESVVDQDNNHNEPDQRIMGSSNKVDSTSKRRGRPRSKNTKWNPDYNNINNKVSETKKKPKKSNSTPVTVSKKRRGRPPSKTKPPPSKTKPESKRKPGRKTKNLTVSPALTKNKDYEETGLQLNLPSLDEIKPLLEMASYKFYHEAGQAYYCRSYGDKREYPDAQEEKDYFLSERSFRSYLCAHGVEYVGCPPWERDQEMKIETWVRHSILSTWGKNEIPKLNMTMQQARFLLKNSFGIYNTMGRNARFAIPGPEPLRLKERELFEYLARNGLPKEQETIDDTSRLALEQFIARYPDLEVFVERKEGVPNANTSDAILAPPKESTDTPQMAIDDSSPSDDSSDDSSKSPATDGAAWKESNRAPYHENASPVSRLNIMEANQDDAPQESTSTTDAADLPHESPVKDSEQSKIDHFPSPVAVAPREEECNDRVPVIDEITEGKVTSEPEDNASAQTSTIDADDQHESTAIASEPTSTDHSSPGSATVAHKEDHSDQIPVEKVIDEKVDVEETTVQEVVVTGDTVRQKLESCLDLLRKEAGDVMTIAGNLSSSLTEIRSFVRAVVTSKGRRGGVGIPPLLHVCGAPGSGKSMGIKMICNLEAEVAKKHFEQWEVKPKFVFVNASHLCNHSKHEAMKKTLEYLGAGTVNHLKRAQDEDASKKAALILVLDEIDHLVQTVRGESGTEEYLKTIIDCARDENMLLGVIGISNSVENSKVARLRTLGFEAKKVIFNTYEKNDLIRILESRVGRSVVDPKVVEYFASKVSASSGDARKFFEMISRVVNVAMEKLSETELGSSHTEPVVKLKHAMVVIRETNVRYKDLIEGLPHFEKYVLVVAVHLSRVLGSKPLTLGRLKDVCLDSSVEGLTSEDIKGILERLDDAGLLKLGNGKSKQGTYNPTTHQINFDLQLEDVEFALEQTLLKEDFYQRLVEKVRSLCV